MKRVSEYPSMREIFAGGTGRSMETVVVVMGLSVPFFRDSLASDFVFVMGLLYRHIETLFSAPLYQLVTMRDWQRGGSMLCSCVKEKERKRESKKERTTDRLK